MEQGNWPGPGRGGLNVVLPVHPPTYKIKRSIQHVCDSGLPGSQRLITLSKQLTCEVLRGGLVSGLRGLPPPVQASWDEVWCVRGSADTFPPLFPSTCHSAAQTYLKNISAEHGRLSVLLYYKC